MHQNISSVIKPNYPVCLYELKDTLCNIPKTTFVFAHCVIWRRISVPFYYKMTERLLDQYQHLYMNISWIIFDEIICPGGVPNPRWTELIEKYSHRFRLGSNLVTRFERVGIKLSRYDVFFRHSFAGGLQQCVYKNC